MHLNSHGWGIGIRAQLHSLSIVSILSGSFIAQKASHRPQCDMFSSRDLTVDLAVRSAVVN